MLDGQFAVLVLVREAIFSPNDLDPELNLTLPSILLSLSLSYASLPQGSRLHNSRKILTEARQHKTVRCWGKVIFWSSVSGKLDLSTFFVTKQWDGLCPKIGWYFVQVFFTYFWLVYMTFKEMIKHDLIPMNQWLVTVSFSVWNICLQFNSHINFCDYM